MRLKHITFTGIDAQTDIECLRDIQRRYPIAEFGVLTSYHWYENGNRYLDPRLINNLRGKGLNLALHVCGSAAHDAAVGDWNKIESHLSETFSLFKRIQLNVSNRKDNPLYLWLPPYVNQELIVQQHDTDNLSLYNQTYDIWRGENCVSVLLDASGGQGIDAPLKVFSSNGKVGYAGGFNPDNVGEKLTYLLEHVETGDFWIDMESGVRTDDWFDIEKVSRVLTICKEVMRELHVED